MSKDFVQIANNVVVGVGYSGRGRQRHDEGFSSLAIAATAPNAIDTKTKELMALAIGIAVHCDGCVAYHTKMAHQHGAIAAGSSRNRRARCLHGRWAGSRVWRRCRARL